MRVGFFTDTYFPQISGVATSIKTLKDELEREGHEVLIFTTSDPKADKAEEGIIRLGSIPFISFKDRRVVVRGMIDAYEKAKHYHLDIVHTHTEFGVGVLGKYIGYRMGIPVVHTYHTMYEDYLHYIAHGKIIRPFHVRQVTRAFTRNTSGIICPSQRVVDTLKSYDITVPLKIIPTGVDLEKFAQHDKGEEQPSLREEFSLAEDAVILLSLSRLSFEKNIQAVIDGMVEITKVHPEIKLLVVGGGPYSENLKKQAEELNLNDAIIFVGEVDNQEVGRYYREANYFVSASASESQGLTYIEALASRTQLVVKGNDYLDTLVDHPSIGVTYDNDEDFAETVLAYIAANEPTDEAILTAKMYDISSLNFGQRVNKFYAEAQTYYDVFVRPAKTRSHSLPLRLFKRR